MVDIDVILITVDCLRPDHLSCYGYKRKTSPNIDELGRTGTIFTNAFAHGGGTPESFPSILAGANPPTNVKQYTRIMRRNRTLAELMKSLGYETGAIHSNPYLSRFYSYDRGYDYFCDSIEDTRHRRMRRVNHIFRNTFSLDLEFYLSLIMMRKPPILTASEVNERAIRWIVSRTTKYFLWLHYMDVHQPTLPKSRYMQLVGAEAHGYYSNLFFNRELSKREGRYSSEDLGRLNDLYDASIRYVDNCIGELVNTLQKTGRFNKTLVILTSDHGENLGEHGRVGHGSVSEQVVRVPLIFSGPGINHEVVTQPVTHLGLMSAIRCIIEKTDSFLEPLAREYKRIGRGILSLALNYPIQERIITIRTDKWKYIRREDQCAGQVESRLYDIGMDPLERYDKSKIYPAEVRAFEEQVEQFIIANETGYESGNLREISISCVEELAREQIISHKLRNTQIDSASGTMSGVPTTGERATISIKRELFNEIQAILEGSGEDFRSVEDYVEFVVREIINRKGKMNELIRKDKINEPLTRIEEEEIEQRLRRLGYA